MAKAHCWANRHDGFVLPGDNRKGDEARHIAHMRAQAAIFFPDWDVGGGKLGIIVGEDSQRKSKPAVVTAPMTWQLMRGAVAHLCSADVTGDEDALNAGAVRWGSALSEGYADIFDQVLNVRSLQLHAFRVGYTVHANA